MKKILVLRFSSLGDIVMTTAMVRALRQRFSEARLDMAVREDFLDLISANPRIDRKIGLSRESGLKGLGRLAEELNDEGYDLVYDAHRSLRTRMLMPRLRAAAKAYLDKRYVARSLALTLKFPRLKDTTRMLERFTRPLEPWGVRYDGKGPEVFVVPAAAERVKPFIPRVGPGIQTVGFIPSAQWPGKRWPLTRFRQVLENLVRETPHHAIVFGGREDTFCEALCDGLPRERVTNVQGKLRLGESIALLDCCDAVVANDTGLMHVADALGIPSVLILGPTSAELGCLPYHPRAQILEHDLWCRPCSKNGQAPCIRGKRLCLEKTEAPAVVAALHRALEGTR